MLSLLVRPQCLRRKWPIITMQSLKRSDLTQPMSPSLQTTTKNPCVCESGTGGISSDTSGSGTSGSGTTGSGSGTSGCGGGPPNGGGRSSGERSRHQITYMPYQPPPPKQHDYKNMDLGRPMSPHLTIYAPTITATTSILQRITGIILVSYAVLLSGGSLFLSNGVETYVSMIQSLDLNRLSILIIKLIIGIPFAFHYSNGIRFCMWNAARWMAMKDVFESARRCFIMTAIIAVVFALI